MRIRSPELASDPALDLVDQHLAVDHAEAVFFREIFYADDGWHRKSRKLEVGRMIRLRGSGVTREMRPLIFSPQEELLGLKDSF